MINRVVSSLAVLGATTLAFASPAWAGGTVQAAPGWSSASPPVSSVVSSAASSACRMSANIWRRSNTVYQIGAGAGGCGRGLYAITCRPIHRHSFYWHQHGIYSKSQNNAILYLTPRIRGTNGDHYKAKCWFYLNNRLLGTRTTHTIEL
ncbi:hypothetical protein [Thermoactinospora rubra]|uniref:hypothetical protein n=1 Tax=Thermoactinospora rubra TaxID=1088767 RepID=UPI000A10D803|nr:hypothetical protein [Thermoactinospora rubra]